MAEKKTNDNTENTPDTIHEDESTLYEGISQIEFDEWFDNLLDIDIDLDIFDTIDLESESEVEESENLFKEAKNAYNKVDDKLLDFIGNFVVNQDNAAKQKKKLKDVFFWFTMISFVVIILTPIFCLIVLMLADVYEYYIVFGAITASIVEVLTTIIVLPKIVAEYLFNKEEENANIKIVELMQKYSEMIHGYDADSK